MTAPSPWIERFAPLIPAGRPVLDLACGGGRHTRFLLALGHPVTAVDRDISGLEDIDDARLTRLETDLEDGGPWPLPGRHFAGIVITNYLYRPLFESIIGALEPAGILIYDTFARGNERFGKPSNHAFLLKPGELLAVAAGAKLRVLAYEDLAVTEPKPACVQRLCAVVPA